MQDWRRSRKAKYKYLIYNKMKRLVCTFAVLLVTALGLFAQEDQADKKVEKPWNIALKGGGDFSLYENAFTYKENGQFAKLINYQGGLAIGYDFTKRFGIRLDAIYAKNAGAGNTLETSAHGFYPYTFSSVSAFLDAVMNLNPLGTVFHPKFYAGLGGAYAFGFTDMDHPWQELPKHSGAFGIRLGFIAEVKVSPTVGIYADFASEGFTDKFNGIIPTKEDRQDKEKYQGYPGFPFDVRGLASLGVCFHF